MTNRDKTIHDVAREAGVSASTVSRVLNGTASVTTDKAERVRKVVERLNYKPNAFARSLLGHASDAVGVLVPQLEDEFYGKVVTGIEARLRVHGLHVLCSLGHDQRKLETEALRLFRERQVAGLVLVADHLPESAILELVESKLPLVLVNRFVPELAPHCIRLDNVWSGALATRHLLELGHTRIAHIAGSLSREGARGRLEGYRDALRQAEVPRDDRLVVEADFSEEGGREAMKRLLNVTGFTAVFAANDRMAAGALNALREARLRVPEDVSVVGFDNAAIARFTYPALTTIDYPVVEMGQRAADHLASLIGGKSPPDLPLIKPSLITRGSTTPPTPNGAER